MNENPKRYQELYEMLLQYFSIDEFRGLFLLDERILGSRFFDHLPSIGTPTVNYWLIVVEQIRLRNVATRDFFEKLCELRPGLHSRITEVAAFFDATPRLSTLPAILHRLYHVDSLPEGGIQVSASNPQTNSMDRLALANRLADLTKERSQKPFGDPSVVNLNREIFEIASALSSESFARGGDIVVGCRLLHVVGTGDFGTVWRACDDRTGESVAVKIFHLDKLPQATMFCRFRRSVDSIQKIKRRHPTADTPIAIIREVADDCLAFSMAYFPRGSLEQPQVIADWNFNKKLQVILAISRAVEFAHSSGIVHRDIKPSNIMLDEHFQPYLTDFDLSSDNAASTTLAGTGLGTPIFAAPEQVQDSSRATIRSDIYSLGRVLIFLLLARPPELIRSEEQQLSELSGVKEVSHALIAVIRKATQIDPSQRFASVAEFISALELHHTGWARVQAWFKSLVRWTKLHRLALAFLVTVLVFAFAMTWRESYHAQIHEENFRIIAQINREYLALLTRTSSLVEQRRSLRDEEEALLFALASAPVGTAAHGDLLERLRRNDERSVRLDRVLGEHQGKLQGALSRLQHELATREEEVEGADGSVESVKFPDITAFARLTGPIGRAVAPSSRQQAGADARRWTHEQGDGAGPVDDATSGAMFDDGAGIVDDAMFGARSSDAGGGATKSGVDAHTEAKNGGDGRSEEIAGKGQGKPVGGTLEMREETDPDVILLKNIADDVAARCSTHKSGPSMVGVSVRGGRGTLSEPDDSERAQCVLREVNRDARMSMLSEDQAPKFVFIIIKEQEVLTTG